MRKGKKSSQRSSSGSRDLEEEIRKDREASQTGLPTLETFQEEEKTADQFGRYKIVEALATGGMAQIYKAQTSNNRVFTLKKILRNFSTNPEFIKMFLEEAKISLSLKHPNVIRVLDFGNLDGTYYLAMEYVFGRDLASLLKLCSERRTFIPLDVACAIIMQCAKGLDYAHTQVDSFGNAVNIVHRDISPPNILSSYNGEVKILDFGIAKAIRSTSKKNTRSGVLKGKFSYMSPEQAMGQEIDHQSDIFSLGIVFWELLTSRSLFYSEDEFETLERVRAADAKPPSSIRKEIPAELDQIVMKALAHKTKSRYQSCWDFAEDIKAFLTKHFPRSDDRTIAKFMRNCFPEDYLKRLRSAQAEGWRDVLQVGGADDDLMLDQGLETERTYTASRIQSAEITWHQRLLYDPKVQGRMFKLSSRIGLGLMAVAITLMFATPSGRSQLTSAWKSTVAFFVEPNLEQTEDEVSERSNRAPIVTGDFSSIVQRAQAAEEKKNYRLALELYQSALAINPYEQAVITRKYFMMLSAGQYEEACAWFSAQKNLEQADRLLAEGACFEIQAEMAKAYSVYSEFLRRFPDDPRVDQTKEVVNALKKRWPD